MHLLFILNLICCVLEEVYRKELAYHGKSAFNWLWGLRRSERLFWSGTLYKSCFKSSFKIVGLYFMLLLCPEISLFSSVFFKKLVDDFGFIFKLDSRDRLYKNQSYQLYISHRIISSQPAPPLGFPSGKPIFLRCTYHCANLFAYVSKWHNSTKTIWNYCGHRIGKIFTIGQNYSFMGCLRIERKQKLWLKIFPLFLISLIKF